MLAALRGEIRLCRIGSMIVAVLLVAGFSLHARSGWAEDVGGEAKIVRHAEPKRGIITIDDYPRRAIKLGIEGDTFIKYSISEKGRVTTCVLLQSSGSDILDRQTCRIVARFRYGPAKDAAGNPIEEWWKLGIRWKLPRHITLVEPEPIS